MIPYNSLVVCISPKGRRKLIRLEENATWHSNAGTLDASQIYEANFGSLIYTRQGVPLMLQEPTLEDKLHQVKRQTQVIYPKDIAWICLKLGAGPNRRIGESGCGSGALTMALSWYCGDSGKVYTHEAREEFLKLAQKNLAWADLGSNVEWFLGDIVNGFQVKNLDAIFLDVRTPWLYLKQALDALKSGGTLGFILPTTEQISTLLLEMEKFPLANIEVQEIFMRPWKAVPDRLRPADRMTAHTGFLVFCKQQNNYQEFLKTQPLGTRERKQEMAKLARINVLNESEDNLD